jgi:hypothetical protein
MLDLVIECYTGCFDFMRYDLLNSGFRITVQQINSEFLAEVNAITPQDGALFHNRLLFSYLLLTGPLQDSIDNDYGTSANHQNSGNPFPDPGHGITP